MSQLFFDSSVTEVSTSSLPLKVWIQNRLWRHCSPFVPVPGWLRLLTKLVVQGVVLLEVFLKKTLLVTVTDARFAWLDVRMQRLITDLLRTGIIKNWYFLEQQPDVPKIACCMMVLSDQSVKGSIIYRWHDAVASGVGVTLRDAVIPALGEVLERSAMVCMDRLPVIKGSAGMFGPRAMSLMSVRLYSETQFAQPEFEKWEHPGSETQLGWVQAREVVTMQERLVPAQLVFLSYFHVVPEEVRFCDVNSNGAAVAVSKSEAILKAIYEVFERDAFFTYWLTKNTPPSIVLESVPSVLYQRIKLLEQSGFRVQLFALNTDMPLPTVGLVMIDNSGGSRPVIVELACDSLPERALQKVIDDALRAAHAQRSERNGATFARAWESRHHIKLISERAYLWSHREMIQHLDIFTMGSTECTWSQVCERASSVLPQHASSANELSALRSFFKDMGIECYVVDITTELCRQNGLVAIKVIMPHLVAPYFNEKRKPEMQSRLYTLPQKLGWRAQPQVPNDLNQVPHPFL